MAYDNWKNSNFNDIEIVQNQSKIYKEKCTKVKQLINKVQKASFVNDFKQVKTIKDKWNLIKAQGCCKDSDKNDEDILNNFNLNELIIFLHLFMHQMELI